MIFVKQITQLKIDNPTDNEIEVALFAPDINGDKNEFVIPADWNPISAVGK